MKLSVIARRLALSVAYRRLGLTAKAVSRLPKNNRLNDYLAVADLIDRLMEWGRVVNDSVVAQDSLGYGLIKALNDEQALEDLVSLGYLMQQGDTAAVADAVELVVAFQRDIPESLLVQDTLIRDVGKELADTMLTSDAPLLALTKLTADTLDSADALAFAVSKVLGDTATVSDVFNLIATYPRNFAETLSATDTFSGWSLNREFSDVAYQTDSSAWSASKALSDATSLDDVVGIAVHFLRDLTDSVLMTDYTSYFMGGNEIQTPSDTTVSEDSMALDTLKSLSDAVAPLDALLISLGFSVDCADVVDAVVDELVLAVTQRFYEPVSVDDALTSVDTTKNTEDAAAAVALPPVKSLETTKEDVVAAPADDTSLGVAKAPNDTTPVTDESTLATEPNFSESAVASAEGTWRMQDYVDPTYLAEDYVGSSGSL